MLFCAVTCKPSDFITWDTKTSKFHYSLWMFVSNYCIPNISISSFNVLLNLLNFILYFGSEIHIYVHWPSNVTNIAKILLSLTTLTPSAIVQPSIQLYNMQQVCALSLFPYLTWHKTVVSKEFQLLWSII